MTMMIAVTKSLEVMMTMMTHHPQEITTIWEIIERDLVRTGLDLTKKAMAAVTFTRVGSDTTDTALEAPVEEVEEDVEAEEEDVEEAVVEEGEEEEEVGQDQEVVEREVMMMYLSSLIQLMEASLMVAETGLLARTNRGTVPSQQMVLLMVSQWEYTLGLL